MLFLIIFGVFSSYSIHMKRTILFIFSVCYCTLSFAQETFQLHVAFDNTIQFSSENDYKSVLNDAIPDFNTLSQDYSFTLEKGIAISEARLQQMEEQALRISGDASSVKQLRNILSVTLTNASQETLTTFINTVEKLEHVLYCTVMSTEPIEPPFDIPPTTDDFEPQQTYIGPDPGVNMTYAWDMGLSGEGINIRDVEYGLNTEHEEFNEVNAYIADGMTVEPSLTTAYTEHGTATFGVLYAHKGDYGISGMAHSANEVVLYPEYTVENGYNRAYAVSQAIDNSAPGDVILYEMQTGGAAPGDTDYVPAEYNPVVWNLTKAATDAGIVIVAAAGNGNQNLDGSLYSEYMNRGDSGAIIVGAGTPDTAHNKLGFSTYGSRVNVQGWGLNVISTGYGDLYMIGGDFNQNYTMFSGTSSATPIVASCAIVLQSYYFDLTGNYLTSQQLRDILMETGISQGSGGHIGPLPNMEAAINHINTMMSTAEFANTQFVMYPNPTKDQVTVVANGRFSDHAVVRIHNSLGQTVYQSTFRDEMTISVADLVSGVYFVDITEGNATTTKRLIKN